VTVLVTPATLTVQNQGTATFSATVGGAATTDVDWSVEGTLFNPKGTITAGGSYTAPSAGTGMETVVARSRQCPQASATATVTVATAVVTVSPEAWTMQAGSTAKQFSALVNGSAGTVTWSVNPDGTGTVSSGGLYTPPSTVQSSTTVRVIATSSAHGGVTGWATVTVVPSGQSSIAVTPVDTTINPGGQVTLTAQVVPAGATVEWSESQGGYFTKTVSGDTRSVTYVAPAQEATGRTITVTAKIAQSNPAVTAVAGITVRPTGSITIGVSPASVTLGGGGTQVFQATATGQSNNQIAWSLSPPVGSLSPSPAQGATVTYTAPGPVSASQQVTLTATSLVNGAVKATAVIHLVAPPQVITITPSTAVVYEGLSQQFVADSAVNPTWTISPTGVGTFSSTGKTATYTAPTNLSGDTNLTITASTANGSGTATVVARKYLPPYVPNYGQVSVVEAGTDWFTFSAVDANEQERDDISWIQAILNGSSSSPGPAAGACYVQYDRFGNEVFWVFT